MKKTCICVTIIMVENMEKLKLDRKRILLISSIGLVCLILVFLLYNVFNKNGADNPIEDDLIVDTTRPYEIDLVEYDVYDLKELDFNFIIAKFRIRSNLEIDIPLSLFMTSETLVLSEVDFYLSAMTEKSLYVGRRQVVFEIRSEESEVLVNLFIPIKDKALQKLSLTLPEELGVVEFDLSMNVSEKNDEFVYNADEVITDGSRYSMTVSSAFEITGESLYFQDVLEIYPSTAELHAFYLDIESLSGEELIIEDAKYVEGDNGSEFQALGMGYSTEKRDGIIGKVFTSKETGCLFFITLNPERLPITYTGDLYIKLKGLDYWVKVQVGL